MSIQTEIERLENAKSALKTSITNKGVTVDEGKKINEYSALVDSIVELKGQTKTVAPSTSEQTISPDAQYNGLTSVTVNAVTSAIDSNIVAGNIKKDVSILGVTGTYAPEEEIDTPDTTIQNGEYGLETATSGEGDNDTGYKFYTDANIQSKLYETGSIVEIHITNELLAQVLGITAEKIKAGETIAGVAGTYTGTAEAEG